MRTYKIDELYGDNWINAIVEVLYLLNRGRDNKLFYMRDKFFVEEMAQKLGVRFTENGNIVR